MMLCNDIRNRLNAFIDGEIQGEERTLIQEHLDICSDCKAELDSIIALNNFLRDYQEQDLDDALVDKIVSSCVGKHAKIIHFSNLFRRVPLAASVAAAFLLGIYLGISTFNTDSQDYLTLDTSQNSLVSFYDSFE
ncbi:MAG: anti-sigma factor [Candidatus Cloacimonetes bacterium]|nr:anti-sigma factor [Candidatus Cloacimonadota bacterium]